VDTFLGSHLWSAAFNSATRQQCLGGAGTAVTLDEDELLMLLISTPGQQQGRHSIPVRIVKLRTGNIIKKIPVSAKRYQFFSLHIFKTFLFRYMKYM
jgi:hypothetical protein